MAGINLNEVAQAITKSEGLKKSVKIGDVKEILSILFRSFSLLDIIKMYFKYNKGVENEG